MFRVLHVCTGNICRSPLAEHLMRAGLAERMGSEADDFVISSSGTLGFTGDPMQPFAHSTLAARGVDGSAFVARALAVEQVEEADLILSATRTHRGKVAVLSPRVTARSFTLREFARLVSVVDRDALPEGSAVERARALVQAAAANRGLVPAEAPEDDDLEDPYTGPESGYALCADLVHAALQGPLDLIAGLDPRG
ncbi:MAG: Tyrosine phosphatase [Frankiales bacterium]|nr:Tyrosine phosphatase [Frankiales bacterium]